MILREETNAILSNAILKEERGVAAAKYRDVVNEIVEYCKENIGNDGFIGRFFKNLMNKPGEYKVKIPNSVTKKIDFIDNLHIFITFKEMGSDYVTSSGGGQISYQAVGGKYFTDDGKIAFAKIELDAFHHNGKLLTRTLTNSLYHELNHAYDVWSRSKNFAIENFNKNVTTGYLVSDGGIFSPNKEVSKFFSAIFYRLFIPTEFNAMISGVYGDLMGMDSKRINYAKDLHNTQAAWILDWFTENFDEYLGMASIDALMIACKTMGIDDVSRQDPHIFLITFKQSFERKIREAWKRIGRVASMWYDNKEESELNDNGLKME